MDEENHSQDIRGLLRAWPYDPENDARVLRGVDGREVLQVRTILGIEQYEMDGRPDGERPYGRATALEHHMWRLAEADKKGKADSFKLTPRQCGELFNEGTLFYFRYVRLFQLQRWQETIRDTERNLKAFDFINRHAEREEDRLFLEKWRPYIIRVHATASVMLALATKDYDLAQETVRAAIAKLEALDDIEDETFHFERERSLTGLKELMTQVQESRPLSDVEKLEEQLRKAISSQNFERAAVLRDRIRALKNEQKS